MNGEIGEEPDRDMRRKIKVTCEDSVKLALKMPGRTEYVKIPAKKPIEILI